MVRRFSLIPAGSRNLHYQSDSNYFPQLFQLKQLIVNRLVIFEQGFHRAKGTGRVAERIRIASYASATSDESGDGRKYGPVLKTLEMCAVIPRRKTQTFNQGENPC
jgi:hypothetical protein